MINHNLFRRPFRRTREEFLRIEQKQEGTIAGFGNPTGFTYMIDGNSAELKKRKDGSYYLALDTGVYSNHLQDTNDYSISDGTNTYTITMSVLTYARSCAGKAEKEVSDLGKALYLYNQAAVAAFY